MSSRGWTLLWIAVIVLATAVPVRFLFDRKLMYEWLTAGMIITYVATWSIALRARKGRRPGRGEVGVAILAWLSLLLSSMFLLMKMPTS